MTKFPPEKSLDSAELGPLNLHPVDADVDNKWDSQFETGRLKHRNWLAWMDYMFAYMIHPFVLTLIMLLLAVVYFSLLFAASAIDSIALKNATNDIGNVLSYGGCALVTYSVTVLFQRGRDYHSFNEKNNSNK
jgi:hypothetical protein